MADNITLNSGSGGATIRTDDDGTAHWQYVKLAYGADNTQNIVTSTASNPLPVALSDTDNAVLDNIQTAVELIDNAISGSEMQVDIVSGNVTNAGTFVVQVDGDALTALQVIDNAVHVDDAAFTLGTHSGVMMMGFAGTQSVNANDAGAIAMETDGSIHIHDGGNTITVDGTVTANLSATDNTVLDNIQTAVELIDNAISGSEMQVDVVAALPAGTNAIGKLAANSGVDIGDVDVLSVVAGTGATNLGKAVDAVAGGSDTGVAMLAVRDDELAAQAADADYVQLRADQFGRLRVTNLGDSTSEAKRAIIDAANNGDNTLVAAAGAGIKIKVLAAFMVAAGTVNARFEDGAAGTALTGQMNLVANTGFVLPYNPEGWFETSDNTLLNLELSAAVSVDGCLVYVED